jgi:uncharacterized protein (TIGR00251 family)
VKNGSTPLVIHVRLCRATFLYEAVSMPDIADALLEDRHGTIIALEVTTGAKNDSFPAGYNVWRKTIGCRVTAPAVEGKANRAIIRLVSEILAVPATTVSIQSGATSSQKRVLVTGIDKKDLLDRLKGISGL